MSDWFKVIAYMQLSKIITVHAQLGYFQTQKLQITPLYIPQVVWRASHIEPLISEFYVLNWHRVAGHP